MAYKIPKAEVLAEAIQAALKEQSTVVSQNRFAILVNDQLKKVDPEYTASEERIRRVALYRKLAKVEIQGSGREEPKRPLPGMRFQDQANTERDGIWWKGHLGLQMPRLRLLDRDEAARTDPLHLLWGRGEVPCAGRVRAPAGPDA
jgi:hypothetical protein